jgi:uncharacterized protein YkwD
MLSEQSGAARQILSFLRRFLLPGQRLGVGLLLFGGLSALATASVVAIDPPEAEQQLIILTNVDRTSNGVSALVPDDALRGVARFRSEDMVARGYFSHIIPPEGHQVFDILDERGVPYLRAGENLGRNNSPDYITVQTVEQAFMNSPRHRAILLWPGYTNLGTGVAEGGEGMKVYTVLFTQVPPGAPVPQPTPTPIARPSPEPTGASVPSATATQDSQVTTPTETATASAAATPTPCPTLSPSSVRVELPPARSMGLIEHIVRRVLSLFLNLG